MNQQTATQEQIRDFMHDSGVSAAESFIERHPDMEPAELLELILQANAARHLELQEARRVWAAQTDRLRALENVALTGGVGLEAKNLAQLSVIAEHFHEGGVTPPSLDTPQKLIVAMAYGQSLGLGLLQSCQSVYVVNGRPTLWGDAVPGLVMARAKNYADTTEYWELNGEILDRPPPIPHDRQFPAELVAVCEVYKKGRDEPIVGTFSIGEAMRAGLYPLKNTPWRSYPARMSMMRARVAYRNAFPDLFSGLLIAEEMIGHEQADAATGKSSVTAEFIKQDVDSDGRINLNAADPSAPPVGVPAGDTKKPEPEKPKTPKRKRSKAKAAAAAAAKDPEPTPASAPAASETSEPPGETPEPESTDREAPATKTEAWEVIFELGADEDEWNVDLIAETMASENLTKSEMYLRVDHILSETARDWKKFAVEPAVNRDSREDAGPPASEMPLFERDEPATSAPSSTQQQVNPHALAGEYIDRLRNYKQVKRIRDVLSEAKADQLLTDQAFATVQQAAENRIAEIEQDG